MYGAHISHSSARNPCPKPEECDWPGGAADLATPCPSAATTPATSQPRMNGGGPRSPPPALVFQSTGFTPAASTRTSTSVPPGSGRGTVTMCSTPGGPSLSWLTARIIFSATVPPSCPCPAAAAGQPPANTDLDDGHCFA
jgi:hypothetical protein